MVLLSIWLTVVVFGIADEFHISREAIGKYLIVLALGFLSTLVHELGHAFVAWRLGYKVRKIAVLPLEFDVQNLQFRSASLPRSSDIAGYVIASISNKDSPIKIALFAFGGPVAELAMAAVIFAGLSLHSNSNSGVFVGLATMLGAWASGSAVINLVPIGGSDGYVIWKSVRRFLRRSSN